MRENPAPSSYSDVEAVEQQVNDDACEGNRESVRSASQPCDPQVGAFSGCGAHSTWGPWCLYQWCMTVRVLLLDKTATNNT